jgi:plasmid stabilization system protein ParE
LRRIAKRDLREAITWYRERDPDLARRFLDEVYSVLALLERFPHTGGPVSGIHDADIRQLPVSNFPYQVVFKRMVDRTSVLAIAHERRKPGYWNN